MKHVFMLLFGFIIFTTAEAIGSETNAPETRSIVPKDLRDPFWPVGYLPQVKEVANLTKQQARIEAHTKWPKLELQGITRTGRGDHIAVIKDIGVIESGDIVSMRKDNLIYRWRINAISSKGISRTRIDVRESMLPLQE